LILRPVGHDIPARTFVRFGVDESDAFNYFRCDCGFSFSFCIPWISSRLDV